MALPPDDDVDELGNPREQVGIQVFMQPARSKLAERTPGKVVTHVTRDGECSSCRFWREAPELTKRDARRMLGLCRRHAPQRGDTNTHGLSDARWPVTADVDSCGDYEP